MQGSTKGEKEESWSIVSCSLNEAIAVLMWKNNAAIIGKDDKAHTFH